MILLLFAHYCISQYGENVIDKNSYPIGNITLTYNYDNEEIVLEEPLNNTALQALIQDPPYWREYIIQSMWIHIEPSDSFNYTVKLPLPVYNKCIIAGVVNFIYVSKGNATMEIVIENNTPFLQINSDDYLYITNNEKNSMIFQATNNPYINLISNYTLSVMGFSNDDEVVDDSRY